MHFQVKLLSYRNSNFYYYYYFFIFTKSNPVFSNCQCLLSSPFLSPLSRQVVFGRVHKRCQKWSLHCAATAVWPQQRFAVLSHSRQPALNAWKLLYLILLCVPDRRVLRKKKKCNNFTFSFSQKGHAYIWRNKDNTCQDILCLLRVIRPCLC